MCDPAFDMNALRAIAEKHKHQPGAMLVILHEIQDTIGHIPDEAVFVIASALSRSQAEVQGVVSFYPHFRARRIGQHVLEICRAESCQAMGAKIIEEHAKSLLGVDWHETTADGTITLEPVYCLGNCACSPSLRVGDDIRGRIDCDSIDELVSELRKA